MEQAIGNGQVGLSETLVEALINVIGGDSYGNQALKGAFARGAMEDGTAVAATVGSS